jgi:hypothetical protein
MMVSFQFAYAAQKGILKCLVQFKVYAVKVKVRTLYHEALFYYVQTIYNIVFWVVTPFNHVDGYWIALFDVLQK